jgi:chaperonin GroES
MAVAIEAGRAPRTQRTHFMDIRPMHDRIIVRRFDEGEQNVGGIIIPDSAKEKPQRGQVIAAGIGKANAEGRRIPLDVKTGDLIVFAKYTGHEITLDGNQVLIMRESEVLAVVQDAPTAKESI